MKKKILLLGPLPGQFRHLQSRVGGDVELTLRDKDKSILDCSSFDHVVITRHVRHAAFEQAVSSVGRERTHVAGSGLTHLAALLRGLP